MSDKRIFLRLSRGISPDLSEPIIEREVNDELAQDAPALITALKETIRLHLAREHGRFRLDGEGE